MSKKRKIMAIGITILIIIAIFGGFIASSGASVYEISIKNDGSTYSAANEYLTVLRQIVQSESSYNEVVFNVELHNTMQKTPSSIGVVLDTTGSMSGNRLEDIKSPAVDAVKILYNRLSNLKTSFTTYAGTQIALESNVDNLVSAIQNSTYVEGNTETALNNAVDSLATSTSNKSIILFTDGTDYPQEKITQIRESGIRVYVVIVDGNLNQITDTQDIYYYTDGINSIIENIITEVEASDSKKDINVKEVIPTDILEYFDLTVDEPTTGEVATNSTGFTWTIDKIMAQETFTLKYRLKLKEGVTIDTSMLNQEVQTNTSLEVTTEGSDKITLSNSPTITIVNTNADEATGKVTIKAVNDKYGENISGIKYTIKARYENQLVIFEDTRSTDSNGEITIDNFDIMANRKIIFELKPISVPTGYEISSIKYFAVDVDISNSSATIDTSMTTETLTPTASIIDGKLVAYITDTVQTKEFTLNIKTINIEQETQALTNAQYKLTDANGKEFTGSQVITADVLGQGKYTFTLTQTQAPALFNIANPVELEIGFNNDGVVTSIETVEEVEHITIPNSAIPEIIVKNKKQQSTEFNMEVLLKDAETSEKIQGEKYKAVIEPLGYEITNLESDENGKIYISGIVATGQTEITFVHIPTEGSIYRTQENRSIIVNIDSNTGVLSVPAGQEIYNGLNKMTTTVNVLLEHTQKAKKNRLEITVMDEEDYSIIQGLDLEVKLYDASSAALDTYLTETGTIIVDNIEPKFAGENIYYYKLTILNTPDAYYEISPIKLKLTFDEEGIITEVTEISNNAFNIGSVYSVSEDEYAVNKADISIALARKYPPYNLKLVLQDENHPETKINGANYYIKVISGGIKAKEYTTDENGEILVDIPGKDKIEIIISQRSTKYGYAINTIEKKLILNVADDVVTFGNDSQNITEEEVTIEGNLITFTDKNMLIVEQEEKARVKFNLNILSKDLNEVPNIKLKVTHEETATEQEGVSSGNALEFPIIDEGLHTFSITQLETIAGHELPNKDIKIGVLYKLDGNEMKVEDISIITGGEFIHKNEHSQYQTDVFMLEFNINIKNEPSNSANSGININKTDNETGEKLTGAKYTITLDYGDESPQILEDVSVDDDVDVQNILIAEGMKITLVEEKAPIGFVKDSEEKIITIQKDSISGQLVPTVPEDTIGITASLTEDVAGNILNIEHINSAKTAQKTQKPFTFKVINVSELDTNLRLTDSRYEISMVQTNGEIEPTTTYTVDENGEITFQKAWAEEITIKVTQKTAAPGYKLDGTVKTLVINRDSETLEMIVDTTKTSSELLPYVTVDNSTQEVILTDVSSLNFLLNVTKYYDGTALSDTKYEAIANEENKYGEVLSQEYDKATAQAASNKVASLAFGKDTENKSIIYTIKETDVPLGYKGNPAIKIKVVFDENGLITYIEKISGSEYILDIPSSTGTKILNLSVTAEKVEKAPVITIDKIDSISEEKLEGATFEVKANLKNADGTVRPVTIESAEGQTNANGNVSIYLGEAYALKTVVYTITELQAPKYYIQAQEIKLEVSYDREGFVSSAVINSDIAKVIGYNESAVGVKITDELDAKIKINITNIDKSLAPIPDTIFRGITSEESRLSKPTNSAGITELNFGAEYINQTVTYTIKSENIAVDKEMKLNVTYDEYGNISNATFSATEYAEVNGWTDKQVNITIKYNVFRMKINFLNEDGSNLNDYENAKFNIAINDGSSVQNKELNPPLNGIAEIILGEIINNTTVTYSITQTQVPYGFAKIENISTTVTFDGNGDIGTFTPISNIDVQKTNTTVLTLNIKNTRLEDITFNINVKDEKHQTSLSELTLDIKTIEIPHSTKVEQAQVVTDQNGNATTILGKGIVGNSIKYQINQTNEIMEYDSISNAEFMLSFDDAGKLVSKSTENENLDIIIDTENNSVTINIKISSKVIIGIEFEDWKDSEQKLYGSKATISTDNGEYSEQVSYTSEGMTTAYIGVYKKSAKGYYTITQESTEVAQYYEPLETTRLTVEFDLDMNIIGVTPDNSRIDAIVPTTGDELYGVVDFKLIIKNRPTARFTINITNELREESGVPISGTTYMGEAILPSDGSVIEEAQASGATNEQGKMRLMFNSTTNYVNSSVKFKVTRTSGSEYTDDAEIYVYVTFDEEGNVTSDEEGNVTGVYLLDENNTEITSNAIFEITKKGVDNVFLTIKSKGETTFTINLTKYEKIPTFSNPYEDEYWYYTWSYNHYKRNYTMKTTWKDKYIPYVSFKAHVTDANTGEVLDNEVISQPVSQQNGMTQLKFNKKYNGKTVIFTISEVEIADYKACEDFQVKVRFDANGTVLNTPEIISEVEQIEVSTEYDGNVFKYGLANQENFTNTGETTIRWSRMYHIFKKYIQEQAEGSITIDGFGTGVGVSIPQVIVDPRFADVGTKEISLAVYKSEKNNNKTQIAIESLNSITNEPLDSTTFFVTAIPETAEAGDTLETEPSSAGMTYAKFEKYTYASRTVKYLISQNIPAADHKKAKDVTVLVTYDAEGNITNVVLDKEYDFAYIPQEEITNSAFKVIIEQEVDPNFRVDISDVRDNITKEFLQGSEYSVRVYTESDAFVSSATSEGTNGITGGTSVSFDRDFANQTLKFVITQEREPIGGYKRCEDKTVVLKFSEIGKIVEVVSGGEYLKANPVGYKNLTLSIENEIASVFDINVKSLDKEDESIIVTGAKFDVIMKNAQTDATIEDRPVHTINEDGTVKIGFANGDGFKGKTVNITLSQTLSATNYKKLEDIIIQVKYDTNNYISFAKVISGNARIEGDPRGFKAMDLIILNEKITEKQAIDLTNIETISQLPIQGSKFNLTVYETLLGKDDMNNPIYITEKLDEIIDAELTNEEGNVLLQLNKTYSSRKIVYELKQENIDSKYIKIDTPIYIEVVYDENGLIKQSPVIVVDKQGTAIVDKNITEEDIVVENEKVEILGESVGMSQIYLNISNDVDTTFTINITNVDKQDNLLVGSEFKISSEVQVGEEYSQDELRYSRPTDENGITKVDFGAEYSGQQTTVIYTITGNTISSQNIIQVKVTFNIFGKVADYEILSGHEKGLIEIVEETEGQYIGANNISVKIISSLFNVSIDLVKDKEDGESLAGVSFNITSEYDSLDITTDETQEGEFGKFSTISELGTKPENKTVVYNFKQVNVPYGYRAIPDFAVTLNFDASGSITGYNQDELPENVKVISTSGGLSLEITNISLEKYMLNITSLDAISKNKIQGFEYKVTTPSGDLGSTDERPELGIGLTDENGNANIFIGYAKEDSYISPTLVLTLTETLGIEKYFNMPAVDIVVNYDEIGDIRECTSTNTSVVESLVVNETNKKQIDLVLKYEPKVTMQIETYEEGDIEKPVQKATYTVSTNKDKDEKVGNIDGIATYYVGNYPESGQVEYKIHQTDINEGHEAIDDLVLILKFENFKVVDWELKSGDSNVINDVIIPDETSELYGKVDIIVKLTNTPVYSIHIQGFNENGERLAGGQYALYKGTNTAAVNRIGDYFTLEEAYKTIRELEPLGPNATQNYTLHEVKSPAGYKVLSDPRIIFTVTTDENGKFNKDASRITLLGDPRTNVELGVGNINIDVTITYEQIKEFTIFIKTIENGTGNPIQGVTYSTNPIATNTPVTTDAEGFAYAEFSQIYKNLKNQRFTVNTTVPTEYGAISQIVFQMSTDAEGKITAQSLYAPSYNYANASVVNIKVYGNYSIELTVVLQRKLTIEFASQNKFTGESLGGAKIRILHYNNRGSRVVTPEITSVVNSVVSTSTNTNTTRANGYNDYTLEIRKTPNTYKEAKASNYRNSGNGISSSAYPQFAFRVNFDANGYVAEERLQIKSGGYYYKIEKTGDYSIKITTLHEKLFTLTITSIDSANNTAQYNKFDIHRSHSSGSYWFTDRATNNNGIASGYTGAVSGGTAADAEVVYTIRRDNMYLTQKGFDGQSDIKLYVKYNAEGKIESARAESTRANDIVEIAEGYEGGTSLSITVISYRTLRLSIQTKDYYTETPIASTYTVSSTEYGEISIGTSKTGKRIGSIIANGEIEYTINKNTIRGYEDLKDIKLKLKYNANGEINIANSTYEFEGSTYGLSTNPEQMIYVVSTNYAEKNTTANLVLQVRNKPGLIVDIETKDKIYPTLRVENAEYSITSSVTEGEGIEYKATTNVDGLASVMAGRIIPDGTIDYTIAQSNIPGYVTDNHIVVRVTYAEGQLVSAQIISGNDSGHAEIVQDYHLTLDTPAPAIKIIFKNVPLMKIGFNVKDEYSGQQIQGVKYNIKVESTNITNTEYTTDEKGFILHENQAFSPNSTITYTITDISTDISYRKMSEIKLEVIYGNSGKILHVNEISKPEGVIIHSDLNSMVELINNPTQKVHIGIEFNYSNNTHIVIKNQDSTLENVGIQGSVFNASVSTPVAEYPHTGGVITDEKGIARLNSIAEEGENITITFSQQAVADGYKMDSTNSGVITIKKTLNPYSVEIVDKQLNNTNIEVVLEDDGAQVTIIVKNDRQLLINLEKVNTEEQPIEGVDFSITTKIGELTQSKEEILSSGTSGFTARTTTNVKGEINLDLGISEVSKKVVYTIREIAPAQGYGVIEPINLVVEFDENGKIKNNHKITKDSYRAKVALEKELCMRVIITNGEIPTGYNIVIKHQDNNMENLGINGSGFEIKIGDEPAVTQYTAERMLNSVTKIEDGVLEQFTDLEGTITLNIKQTTAKDEYIHTLAEGTVIFTNNYVINTVTNEYDPNFEFVNVTGSFKKEDILLDEANREVVITIKSSPKFAINIEKINQETKLPIEEVSFNVISQVVGEDTVTEHGQITTDKDGNASITVDNRFASKIVVFTFIEIPKDGYAATEDICLKVEYDELGRIKSTDKSNLIIDNAEAETMKADITIENAYDSTYKFLELHIQAVSRLDDAIPLIGKNLSVVVEPEVGESKSRVGVINEEGMLIIPNIIANGKIKVTITDINLDAEGEDTIYKIELNKDDSNKILEVTNAHTFTDDIEASANQETGIVNIKLKGEENSTIIGLAIETLDMYNEMNVSNVSYRVTDTGTNDIYNSLTLSNGLAYLRINKCYNEVRQYKLIEIAPGEGYNRSTAEIVFEIDYSLEGDIIDIRFLNEEYDSVLQEQENTYLKFRLYSDPISPDIGPFELEVQAVDSTDQNIPVKDIKLNISIQQQDAEGNWVEVMNNQTTSNQITNAEGMLESIAINKVGRMRIVITYPEDMSPPKGRIYDNREKYLDFTRNDRTGQLDLIDSKTVLPTLLSEDNKVILKVRNWKDDGIYRILVNNVDENGNAIATNMEFEISLPGSDLTITKTTDNKGVLDLSSLYMPETLGKYGCVIKLKNSVLGYEKISDVTFDLEFAEVYGEKRVGNVSNLRPGNARLLPTRGTHYIEFNVTHTSTGELVAGTLKGSISRAGIGTESEYSTTFKLYEAGAIDWTYDYTQDEFTGTMKEKRDNYYGTALAPYEVTVSQTEQEFNISTIAGTYDILIDKPGYLDYIIKNVVITEDGETDLGNIEIVSGDIDKNRSVGAEDLPLVKEYDGKEKDVDPEYATDYDLDDSGAVGAEDLVYVKQNMDAEIIIKENGGE